MARDCDANHCLHPFVIAYIATHVSWTLSVDIIAHAFWTNFGNGLLWFALYLLAFLFRRFGLLFRTILPRPVSTLSCLFGFCTIITDDKMEQWFTQLFVSKDNWMVSISDEFDVSINDTTERCTHADVRTYPCRKEQELVVKKVPSRRPG